MQFTVHSVNSIPPFIYWLDCQWLFPPGVHHLIKFSTRLLQKIFTKFPVCSKCTFVLQFQGQLALPHMFFPRMSIDFSILSLLGGMRLWMWQLFFIKWWPHTSYHTNWNSFKSKMGQYDGILLIKLRSIHQD